MVIFPEKVNPDKSRLTATRLLALHNRKKKKAGSQKLVKPKFPNILTLSSNTWWLRSPWGSSPSSRWTTTGWSSLWAAGTSARTTKLPGCLSTLHCQENQRSDWESHQDGYWLLLDPDQGRGHYKDHRGTYPDFKKSSLNNWKMTLWFTMISDYSFLTISNFMNVFC